MAERMKSAVFLLITAATLSCADNLDTRSQRTSQDQQTADDTSLFINKGRGRLNHGSHSNSNGSNGGSANHGANNHSGPNHQVPAMVPPPIVADPAKVIGQISDPNSDMIYLVRGVNAEEAARTEASGRAGDGRVMGRDKYGILDQEGKPDETVVPGFVINKPVDGTALTADEIEKMYRDATFYATDKGPGKLIIMAVPANTPLTPQPNSNVAVASQVVSIPTDAKLIAVIPPPLRYDENTGTPLYPTDPAAMQAEIAALESKKILESNDFGTFVKNEHEIRIMTNEIIDRYHQAPAVPTGPMPNTMQNKIDHPLPNSTP
jgi:hypothetical protein